jgi:23S rRNA (uracil1939-C5)-methyltransferase
VGFRREESAHLEPLEHCPVLVPALAPLPAKLRRGLESLSGPAIPHEIWLAAGDEGIGIGFCFRQTVGETQRAQLQALGAALGAQTGFGTQSAREPPRWESPPPQLHYSPEEGSTLAFAPWDFTQANRDVNRRLLASVIELLSPGPEDQVLDLFCGIGNFTVPLARRAAAVLGVESSAEHLDTARANAARNGLNNCSFERADLFSTDAVAALPRNRYRLAVLDPPRAGAAAVCAQARALGLRGIVYVSCDTATLARDAALLREGGFKLQAAGVLDMFPQTAHAESLALFTR